MSNISKRELKLFLSEDDCACLCESAAECDLDVSTLLSKVCSDIANLQTADMRDYDLSMQHLHAYLEMRYHESDDGFLNCLYADGTFGKALHAMQVLRSPLTSPEEEKKCSAFLDSLYEEYQEELEEDADSRDIAMEKLEKAYKGKLFLSDADPFYAYLNAIYLAADNNGREDHKDLIRKIQEAYQKIREDF